MCHAEIKSARPSIAPSPEPLWRLALIEPLHPYYLDSGRRSRSDGKLSIPSTSRTLAARRGEPSTNLLIGLDAPFTRTLSRQTPSPRNSWRMGHTGPGTESPPGWSTRSCPTDGRFQHLRVTVSLNPLGGRTCCYHQTPEARKVSGIGFHPPGVHTARRVVSQILVLRLPQFLHAPTQNSKHLEKSTNSCFPEPEKPLGDPKC